MSQTENAIHPSPSSSDMRIKPLDFNQYVDLRRVQDDHISREFRKQRQYTDARFARIEDSIDNLTHSLDDKFEQIDLKFSEIDVQFVQINQRFNEIDKRFDTVDQRFEMMERRQMNRLCFLPHHPISPMLVYRPSGGLQAPSKDIFPRDVGRFWALQKPRRHGKLAQLLRFYDIQEWRMWSPYSQDSSSDSDSDSGSSASSKAIETVDDAVAAYPDLALDSLARVLGLKLEKIQQHMDRRRELNAGTTQAPKRKATSDSVASTHSSTRQDRHLPRRRLEERPLVRPTPVLTLAELTHPSPEEDSSKHSVHTKLGYSELPYDKFVEAIPRKPLRDASPRPLPTQAVAATVQQPQAQEDGPAHEGLADEVPTQIISQVPSRYRQSSPSE